MSVDSSQAKSIFISAVENCPPDQWGKFLDDACGEDAALRMRVELLLKAHQGEDSLLDRGDDAESAAATLDVPPLAERPGQTIGRYKLLEEIGEGGMGVVYMAEQREPVRRKVALKIIKPGMDTREVIARFEAERQALAMMDHPNIAKVLDGGSTEEGNRDWGLGIGKSQQSPSPLTPLGKGSEGEGPGEVSFDHPVTPSPPHPFTSGRPYFVMELVQGIPITEYCDQANLTTRQRLALFVSVCQAVHHAHQKGIIHRDVKPSNVLVTLHDGVPVPKIIDFGIAKAVHQQLTEKSLFTGHGRMMGTPLYMSPEQAEMSGLDVDTRSDIYSLGVLLYELLTGSTPFDGERLREAGFDEVRRVIREEEPPRPSHRFSTLDAAAISTISGHRGVDARRLGRLLRGDLDWIVMKALQKDRTRRYESASALAADVERHLAHEPIQARPPTLSDRAAKWARRHRPLVWSGAAALGVSGAALALGTILVLAAYQGEKEQRNLAAQNAAKSEENAARAQKNYETARRAVDEMYTGVAEKWLGQQAKLTDVQRDFLEKALAFYQEFSEEKGSDPQVRYEAVLALQRVGGIQKKLGKVAAAETAFAQSVKESTDLVLQHPEQPEFRLALAWGQISLARIYRDTGRTKEADQEADRVNEGLTKLATTSFTDAKHRQRLADVFGSLCNELTMAHRVPEAEAAVRSALKICESLVADFPADIEYRYGVAKNYAGQGMQRMWWGGQIEKAELALREAEARLSKLQNERPDDVRFRYSLSSALINLGVIMAWTKRGDEDEKVTARAVQLLEGLVADFPDVPQYQGDLADALNNLASAEKAQGRTLESEKHYRIALGLYESLADRHPDVCEYVRSLESTSTTLVRLLTKKQEKYGEARQVLERALPRAKKALKGNPGQQSLMVSVVNCSTGLASICIDLGDHAQAARAIEDLPSLFKSLDLNRRKPTEEADSKTFVGCLLMNCATLAERDSTLSPVERKKAVQTYTEQGSVWIKEATRAAEEWARNELKNSKTPASEAAANGEIRIRWLELPGYTTDGSPNRREAGKFTEFLLIKALVKEAIARAPDDPSQYQIADLLTSAPEGLRDPELALKLARRAVELKPGDDIRTQSLGWALYRAGDWKGSIESIQKQPKNFGDFVLAMAYWQLGEKTEAKARFDRANEWLKGYEQRCEERLKKGEQTYPPPSLLKRFQAEAAALLGVPNTPPAGKDKTEKGK